MYIFEYICICVHIHEYLFAYVYTCLVRAHRYTCECLYEFAGVASMCEHAWLYMYVQLCMHKCMHIHMYVSDCYKCMCLNVFMWDSVHVCILSCLADTHFCPPVLSRLWGNSGNRAVVEER